MKLQLCISSLTNRKMIDTLVMCLGCLCSLTLWHFVSTFYFMEILDVPLNPKDFLEQTGWRKYISIKRDLSVYHLIEKYWISCEILWWTFSLQFVITQEIFCLHLMSLKCFKTIFQDTEKKMIEIMKKSERSYLVCNVTKNIKKHIQLYH